MKRNHKKILATLLTVMIVTGCWIAAPTASADVTLPPEIILPQGYVLSVGDDGIEHGSYKGAENGLCIFYLLSDGSFLIYDGGQGNKTTSPDAHHLMRRLQKLAKMNGMDEDAICVSAWVFTHAHKDHMGFADVFFDSYADMVDVKEFWFNPVTGDPNGAELVQLLNTHYPRTPVRQLVEGEVIELAGVSVEVLYTPESIGHDVARKDENAASLVMMLTLGTKRVLMTGDASPTSWNWMVAKYPAVDGVSKLKCDYLQVPHHGAAGSGSDAAYALTDAEYLVIPAGEGLAKLTVTPGAFCYWEPTKKLYEQYDDAHKFIAGWHDPHNSHKTQKIQHFVTADGLFTHGPENLNLPLFRMVEGSDGLRFVSRIPKETLDHLSKLQSVGALKPGSAGYSFGTLICKAGDLESVSEFTASALAESRIQYVDIKAEHGIIPHGEDLLISAALINIKSKNSLVDFAAISYVEYHLTDGRSVRVYAHFDAALHARSAYTTALHALSDLREQPTRDFLRNYAHAVSERYVYDPSTDTHQVHQLPTPQFCAYNADQRARIKRMAWIA